MHKHLGLLGFAAASVLVTAQVAAQGAEGRTPASASRSLRTPEGQPDLRGMWTNATITPLERPRNLADKPFLTEAEAIALEKQTAERRVETEGVRRAGDVGSYNQFWLDSGTTVVSTRQTSLVVDPKDGRIPVRPAAEATRDFNLKHVGDSYEFMSLWDRCVTRGVPGGMIPAGYNNAYEIIQTPGYVIISYEMIHEARIIPLDGRPRLPKSVGFWMGDSRGRWEGETLVVETTNFRDKGWVATSAASGRIKGVPQTAAARVVERFTRVDAKTIKYEATVDDPAIFTEPWTMTFPLVRDDEYRIYEYACHEGNHAVGNALRGSRYLEKLAAESSR